MTQMETGAPVVRFEDETAGRGAPRPGGGAAALARARERAGSAGRALSRGAGVRRRGIALGLLFAVLVALLMPMFRSNQIAAADGAFFTIWQADSESLVLAKIESTTAHAPKSDTAEFGLVNSAPDPFSPGARFNQLRDGATPTTQHYVAYPAQLGLQGFLFTGLYDLGLQTQSALWTISTLLTAAAVVAFAFTLARWTRPSFGVVFLIVAAMSPWLTAAARNLYWVPWTWFLPACIAAAFAASRGRRRTVLGVLLFASFALRWGCGFEFLTCVTLLAASLPLLARAFGARAGTFRQALREALVIALIAVAAFVVIAILVMFVAGRGDPVAGFQVLLYDVAKRTYGGVRIVDPALAPSLSASPITVLGMYFLGWPTPVLSANLGWPLTIAVAPTTFWVIAALAAAVPAIRVLRGDGRGARDAVILLTALAVPLSWLLLAKSHAFAHPHIDFVLWYLFSVSAMLWLIGAFAVDVLRRRAVGLRPLEDGRLLV